MDLTNGMALDGRAGTRRRKRSRATEGRLAVGRWPNRKPLKSLTNRGSLSAPFSMGAGVAPALRIKLCKFFSQGGHALEQKKNEK
jgi:hypothetical protein